jgi:pyruvate dehydrogenase E2 component (dihydrolipoamide acetyltransferase)
MTQAETPEDRKIVGVTGLRGIIARTMTQAWQAPRVALGLDIEMAPLLARAKAMTAQGGPKITATPLFLAALARTLKAHPRMNALMTDKGIEEVHAVNLALAVNTSMGLVTPVIRDAEQKSVAELAAEMGDLAERARNGKLPPAAYQKGTFTLSNLGAAGIDWVTPILNPPQVGILGVGRTRDAVIARDGMPVVAQMATLTLVFDHQAIDGFPAGLFLKDLGACLTAADF